VYRGPNVMMGYATAPEDLALGDVSRGVLHTGDLGHLDEDGFLYITGRSKRIGKVFGVRVSLDEVEELVTGLGAVAVIGTNDRLSIFHERGEEPDVRVVRKQLALDLKVPVQALAFRRADPLPVLPSGKPDYQRLQAHVEGQS
jgi:acyl-CoA synthetase (AMP-forming)/AMP-acid ligase II